MSLILSLPPQTNLFQPIVEFTATFNAVTPGFYDWNSVANTDVPFQKVQKNKLYLIEQYSFSADVPEADFLRAKQAGETPTLSVKIPKQLKRQLYPNPIPLINYIDGVECIAYAPVSQDDELTGTFRGRLGQPADLVGVLDITCQVQFNIYEISNKAWIDNALGTTKGGQARGMILPGKRGRS